MMLTEESGSIVPGGVRAYYIPGGAPNIVRGSWNRIDWNFKLSSAEAAADGFHKLYIDGKKFADLTQVSNLDSGDGNTLQHTEITMPNTSRTPTAAMQPHYDDVYIAFTRARVEICENSTWDNTVKKHCEIQPTTTWADGSIGITVNAGSWAGLNDLFIYVVAADDTVNANGYSVGTGDVIPPEMSTSAIGLNGAEFTINYTEAVSQGVSYNDNQLNIDCTQGGNDVGMTYASGNTTNSHVYTLASTININDTCNLDFDGTANSLEDGAGNDLAAIVNGTVINNSGAGSTQSVTGIVTGGANAPNIEKGGANAPDIQ